MISGSTCYFGVILKTEEGRVVSLFFILGWVLSSHVCAAGWWVICKVTGRHLVRWRWLVFCSSILGNLEVGRVYSLLYILRYVIRRLKTACIWLSKDLFILWVFVQSLPSIVGVHQKGCQDWGRALIRGECNAWINPWLNVLTLLFSMSNDGSGEKSGSWGVMILVWYPLYISYTNT